uniref:Uncharacterized protein n=1 Tax=Arundo donax TaxID=35708 RepID=A0A0A9BKC7_ARUDO
MLLSGIDRSELRKISSYTVATHPKLRSIFTTPSFVLNMHTA